MSIRLDSPASTAPTHCPISAQPPNGRGPGPGFQVLAGYLVIGPACSLAAVATRYRRYGPLAVEALHDGKPRPRQAASPANLNGAGY
eukprot:756719-Hanusia_phi.AAC.1